MVKCKACGLVRVAPVPPQETLKGLYGREYFDRWLRDSEVVSKEVARFRRLFSLIGSELPRGRLLSVGCGLGFDLVASAELGFAPEGLEISEAAGEHARRLLGVKVHTGTLDTFDGVRASYSVITFWDVLEHLADPRRALERATSLLSEGGVIVVRAPNIRGLFPVVSRILSPFTQEWRHPEPPAHVFEFSPASIRRLALASGLIVRKIYFDEWPRDKLVLGSDRPNITRGLSAVLYPIAQVLGSGNSMIVMMVRGESGHRRYVLTSAVYS